MVLSSENDMGKGLKRKLQAFLCLSAHHADSLR